MDYSKWEKWSTKYDTDGEEVDLNLKIPLKDVSQEYLNSGQVDLSQVTAECGLPMSQAEFDAYRAKNASQTPIVLE
jgi:hypothetical protein